jgi:hypothetical protein
VHVVITLGAVVYNMSLPNRGPLHALILSVGMLTFLGLTMVVMTQTVPQIGFAMRNSTWGELEKRMATERAYKETGLEQEYEFDSGSVVENLKQRIGKNWLMWGLPIPNEDEPTFQRNPRFVQIVDGTSMRKATNGSESNGKNCASGRELL